MLTLQNRRTLVATLAEMTWNLDRGRIHDRDLLDRVDELLKAMDAWCVIEEGIRQRYAAGKPVLSMPDGSL